MSYREIFQKLRKMVAEEIIRRVEEGCEHKSCEGIWEITLSYPDAFEDPKGVGSFDVAIVTLHCCVLGPSRHYTWKGYTIEAALQRAEKDITEWIKGAV